jgi:effector-binding domain-containing protein
MENAINDLGKENDFALSIVIKRIPSRKVASFRMKIKEFTDEGVLWQTLGEECAKLNVQFSDTDYTIAIQHEINFDENYIDVEVQRNVEKILEDTDKIKFLDVSTCEVASLTFQGCYCKLKDINLYLAKWIIQNDFEIYGPAFNIYYVSPEHERNENKFITEICFPIRKRK